MAIQVSNPGQINKAGDLLQLYKDEFTGEVIKFNKEAKKISNFFPTRKISNAKSASFQYMGNATGKYVKGGTRVEGSNQFAHSEKIIAVDNIYESDVFIGIDDEAMCVHDHVRSDYAQEIGEALAENEEKLVAQTLVLAARASAPVLGGQGGTVIKNTAMATNAAILAASLFKGAEIFDVKKVGDKDRTCFLRPAEYYLLAQNTDLINSLYGGSGAIKDGSIVSVAGIKLIKTNYVPNSVVTADPMHRNVYAGDFSDTIGVICTPKAVATVELMGINTKMDIQNDAFGTLLIGYYMKGHGWVNPQCAIELSKAAT